jgi:colicin import membrane protein
MAQSPLKPLPVAARPPGHAEQGEGIGRWMFLSGTAHLAAIAFLLVTPFLPKTPNRLVPVYTVDLVGSEKLGGGAGTAIEPVPKAKPVPEVKEAKPIVPDKRAEMTEKLAQAKAKKEAEAAEKFAQVKAKKEAEAEKLAQTKAKKEAEMAEKLALAKAKQEAEMAEQLALAKAKQEAEMAERLAKAKKEEEEKRRLDAAEAENARQVREKLDKLRGQRIEEAVAARRAEVEQKQKQEELQRQRQLQQIQQQQRLRQLEQAAQKAAAATSTLGGKEAGSAGFTAGATGTGGGIVKSPEYIRYIAIIKDRVKTSWTWPGKRTDLQVLVRISIQENGEITDLRLVGTSGDRSFDESVIRALRRANPLPAPPEAYRADFLDVNMPFGSGELRG